MNIEQNTQLIEFKLVNTHDGKDVNPSKIIRLTRHEAIEKNYAYALNESFLRYIEVK